MNLSLVYGGEQPQIHGSLRDVSERVRSENLRRDVDRILQHELRSPLNGIVGLGALLRDDANLTFSQREMVDMVVDTGWGMLRMIDESLTLRRLEEGSYTPQLWSLDLVSSLRRVHMWTKPLAQSMRVQVSMEMDGRELVPGEDKCSLRSDGALLEHIFSNLLKNAVEASPAEGRVRIRVACDEDSQHLRVEVCNQGAIPEAVRPMFFERYATSGKVKGTGLGTYIARLSVEALGGTIGFRTSEAEGTVLTVLLPRSEAAACANDTLQNGAAATDHPGAEPQPA
jgi:signal transduction histidine kinase